MDKPRLRVLGVGAALALSLVAATLWALETPEAPRVEPAAPATREVARAEPERNVQEGPLPDDTLITLEQAKSRSPYDLPIPPTTDTTGERTGIWIDRTFQIAFVWSSDMAFYVAPTDMTEEQVSRDWAAKVAAQQDEGWQLTTVRGHTALAKDGRGDANPSAVTWIERGLSIQFVAPAHTLEQLRSFAEAIRFEQ